jgi:hypothetical protein
MALCHERESPFHASYLCNDIKDSILETPSLSSMFSHIKPDLRPCKRQITITHPLYIDALPFPSFRKRIIALRNVEPKIMDERELWSDIGKQGLVCWGTAGPNGSGAPWDRRSWEVKGWFLKKWWMITGGIDGEMGSQSRWWCEMRGETSEVPRDLLPT